MVKHQKRSHRLGYHGGSIPDGLVGDPDIIEPGSTSSQPGMSWVALSVPMSTTSLVAQTIASDAFPVGGANNAGGAVHSTIVKPDPYSNDSQTLHSAPEFDEPQMVRQRSDESHHPSYVSQAGDTVATLISSGATTVPARIAQHDGFISGQTHSDEHLDTFEYEVQKLSGTSEKKLPLGESQHNQRAPATARWRLPSSTSTTNQHQSMGYIQGQGQPLRSFQHQFYLPSQTSPGLMLGEGFRDAWQRPESGAWCAYPQSTVATTYSQLPSIALYDFRMDPKCDSPSWCLRLPQTQITGN
jgi:hypothetical protein